MVGRKRKERGKGEEKRGLGEGEMTSTDKGVSMGRVEQNYTWWLEDLALVLTPPHFLQV